MAYSGPYGMGQVNLCHQPVTHPPISSLLDSISHYPGPCQHMDQWVGASTSILFNLPANSSYPVALSLAYSIHTGYTVFREEGPRE